MSGLSEVCSAWMSGDSVPIERPQHVARNTSKKNIYMELLFGDDDKHVDVLTSIYDIDDSGLVSSCGADKHLFGEVTQDVMNATHHLIARLQCVLQDFRAKQYTLTHIQFGWIVATDYREKDIERRVMNVCMPLLQQTWKDVPVHDCTLYPIL